MNCKDLIMNFYMTWLGNRMTWWFPSYLWFLLLWNCILMHEIVFPDAALLVITDGSEIPFSRWANQIISFWNCQSYWSQRTNGAEFILLLLSVSWSFLLSMLILGYCLKIELFLLLLLFFKIYLFLKLKDLNLIPLQNFLVFCQMSMWISHRYIYAPPSWVSLL